MSALENFSSYPTPFVGKLSDPVEEGTVDPVVLEEEGPDSDDTAKDVATETNNDDDEEEEPVLGEALGDGARDTLGENTLIPRSLVDAFSWNPLFNPFDTASRSFCPSSAWVLYSGMLS